MEFGRKPLSLVELCVRKAIDNLRYMGSVDGVEMDLLKRILPHCTMEQLTRVENSTEMDLSLVTDPLWRRFYQREFGQEHTSKVIARLKELGQKTPYTWRELFAAKKEKQKEVEDKMLDKFTKKFQAERAEKQSKQIKLCTKVPPSSKRSFFGGSGPSSVSSSSYKSPILKKARIEVNSRARLQSAMQKNTFARSSQPIRTTSVSGQPVRTTTIHRPNSTVTITKPMGKSRQIQNSRPKF
ncbi:uncharacterized protein LOC100276576 [Zea mays]|nr:uncharacterized protein LOC100276576 [Zea mays]ACR37802.1 unknown [Zea mays]AQK41230.1 hypothetical protein ZEAMMB73_Zm00001d024462 [Zea mays]AQK41232.1 hypothetical protein ZEAMMB73_Zm00001d024462 [Zea mays]AQK41234.1 hypothetical protein ZEAMMB73_Zm00001d024462 [Zea mays]|eukprot:NP_001143804.2 uncharacterized protein LOC100276576 [Zea mays]